MLQIKETRGRGKGMGSQQGHLSEDDLKQRLEGRPRFRGTYPIRGKCAWDPEVGTRKHSVPLNSGQLISGLVIVGHAREEKDTRAEAL